MSATGSFIWYELMTSDPTAAAKFYGAVVRLEYRRSCRPAEWHGLPHDWPCRRRLQRRCARTDARHGGKWRAPPSGWVICTLPSMMRR